jgi:hypothetical protein
LKLQLQTRQKCNKEYTRREEHEGYEGAMGHKKRRRKIPVHRQQDNKRNEIRITEEKRDEKSRGNRTEPYR